MADHGNAATRHDDRERSGFLNLWDRFRRGWAQHPDQAGHTSEQADRTGEGGLLEQYAILGLHPEDLAHRESPAREGMIAVAVVLQGVLHFIDVPPDPQSQAHAKQARQRIMHAGEVLFKELCGIDLS